MSAGARAVPLSAGLSRRLAAIAPIHLVLVAIIIVAALASDRFLTPGNLIAVLYHSAFVGIVALGMTVVLIGGHFDLSTGAVVMLGAVAALLVGPYGFWGIALAVTVPLALGALVGLANGLAICRAGANSIVVTIGMQFVVTGAVLAAVGGQHVTPVAIDPAFQALASGRLLGVPVPVYIFALLAALLGVLMARTVFGRHIYAIGGDTEAARRAGIAVVRRGIATFILSGVLAALSGVIIAAHVGHLDPTGVGRTEFAALTAAVLGGTSLAGGLGRPADTAAAILVLAVLTNLMTLYDFQYSSQLLAQGAVLTLAVAYYHLRRGGI